MPEYRIVDLLNSVIDPHAIVVNAPTPEKAAELALGVWLTRSGARRNLRARVYSQGIGALNMVHLYGGVSDQVSS